MRALEYCNFPREVRLGGWGSEGPTLGEYVECVRHHSVRKWKYIMRFEIRHFFLEIGLSPSDLTHSQEKNI